MMDKIVLARSEEEPKTQKRESHIKKKQIARATISGVPIECGTTHSWVAETVFRGAGPEELWGFSFLVFSLQC